MDIKDAPKLNELAGQLRKHGISQTSEDAFSAAQKMLGGNPEIAAGTENKAESNPQSQESGGEVKDRPDSRQGFVQKRTEVLIDMTEKRLRSEIAQLRDEIKKMSEDVRTIKDHLTVLVRQNIKVPQHKPEIQPKKQPPQRVMKREDFNPEDISIEKIFYSGRR